MSGEAIAPCASARLRRQSGGSAPGVGGGHAAPSTAVLLPLAMLATLGNRLPTVVARDHRRLTRWCVQPLALVVVDVRDELACGRPPLNGAGVKPAGGCHLLEGEHALSTQAAEAVLETVRLTDVVDDDVA